MNHVVSSERLPQSEMQSQLSFRSLIGKEALEQPLKVHDRQRRRQKSTRCTRSFFAVCEAFQKYTTPEQQKARIPAPVWL